MSTLELKNLSYMFSNGEDASVMDTLDRVLRLIARDNKYRKMLLILDGLDEFMESTLLKSILSFVFKHPSVAPSSV